MTELKARVAAQLRCLARLDRLGDSHFQSITCRMRKKSSGSFTSLCGGLCICEGLLRLCVSVEVLSLVVVILCLHGNFVSLW